MRIADISIRRPVFAVMLIGALVVFGLFSYPRIGVDPASDFLLARTVFGNVAALKTPQADQVPDRRVEQVL